MSRYNLAESSCVFDTFWHFAAERLFMYYRRLADAPPPWTADKILQAHRFTNAYRVTDRVSQYLLREVQYRNDRSQAPDEVFFRTLLFKLFNKIDTWEYLEGQLGPIGWQSANLDRLDRVLHTLIDSGRRIYSAAYIMPSPAFGSKRKHSNHLRLLCRMMEDQLPAQVSRASSLRSVYELLLAYPGIGKFLAFQFAIDLNYSSMIDFSEAEFVVAGPGALDGISKCFPNIGSADAERIIMAVTEHQAEEFTSRGLNFPGLFSRPLQPIDCQNLFCEISKYSRVAHPEIKGVANRLRIKQVYKQTAKSICAPLFPPRWKLDVAAIPPTPIVARIVAIERQASLF